MFLNKIKVIDLTHFIAGPFCGQSLADYGADVIKIEPISGEYSRKAHPMYGEDSLYFSAFNRGKKSLSLDLKSEQGEKVLHKLIKSADVVLTNYSPSTPQKLGFDYETISKLNPEIIMTHITGFGQYGEYKEKSAFDGIIQSMSGIMNLTGLPENPPMKTGIYIADHLAGLQGVVGTLLALLNREITKKGQLVDISMYDSLVSFLSYHLSDVDILENNPSRAGNDSTNVFATTFKTKDDYIYVAPLTDKMWRDFCFIIGRQEWSSSDSEFLEVSNRLKRYQYLKNEIEKWTTLNYTKDIENIFKKYNIACAKINDISDLLNDTHLKQRDMLKKVNLSSFSHKEVVMPGIPIKLSDDLKEEKAYVPELGEHTEEVLSSIGMNEDDIKHLLNEKVVIRK